MVATLGKELGTLRRAHGLAQHDLASALGTAKSNISRLESGTYGGLTIERFLAILDAIHVLAESTEQKGKGRERRQRTEVRPNKRMQPTAQRLGKRRASRGDEGHGSRG
jgi:transcriptional regulator with XRE-family HTH domain